MGEGGREVRLREVKVRFKQYYSIILAHFVIHFISTKNTTSVISIRGTVGCSPTRLQRVRCSTPSWGNIYDLCISCRVKILVCTKYKVQSAGYKSGYLHITNMKLD